MKPLELTVYPLDPAFPAGYKLPRDTRITFAAANRMAKEKRLTSVELAAEYWRAQDDVSCADDPSGSKPGTWPNGYDRENGQFLDDARLETLERFATLPHYDEVPE